MPATEVEDRVIVAPFGVEADHPRNSDLAIQCVPGLRLRSAIDGTRPIIDRNGDARVPRDQSLALGAFPRTPGMQLHVNPVKGVYKVIDPLRDDEELCERIRRFINTETPMRADTKITGVPPQEGELDVHRMKSLCREILNLLKAGHVKVCRGEAPLLSQVEELPGEFLLNPGSRVQNTQPVYEKDWEDWVANLSRQGG